MEKRDWNTEITEEETKMSRKALPKSTYRLTKDIEVVRINGRTGQEIQTETLAKGVLIYDLVSEPSEPFGDPYHTFIASEDKGITWFKFGSYDSIEYRE